MARGSKPGERRGGRKPGVPNKVGADVRAAAQVHSPEALLTLAEIMGDASQPAAARVSAANAILDRAHGKPTQSVETSGPGGGPIQTADASGMVAGLSADQRAKIRDVLKAGA